MKKTLGTLGILLVIISLVSSFAFAGESEIGSTAALNDQDYSLEEMLRYALEDEIMAQAEYNLIMDEFDVTNPFSNIYRSEIRHEEAILNLYEAYELDVPEFDGSNYVILPESLDEVYEIGIQAEINNIAMYEAFLKQDLSDDVRRVFEALKDASVKHLNAFERASGLETPVQGNRNLASSRMNKKNSNFSVNKSMGQNNRQNQNIRTTSECIINN